MLSSINLSWKINKIKTAFTYSELNNKMRTWKKKNELKIIKPSNILVVDEEQNIVDSDTEDLDEEDGNIEPPVDGLNI